MVNSALYSLQHFGAVFLGPAFNSYTRAVHSSIAESSINIPVCLAREGWSIHRLLTRTSDIFSQTIPKPIYLKVSRTLLFKALLGESIVYQIALSNEFNGSLLSLLIKRFGLTFDEVYQCFSPKTFSAQISLPADRVELEQVMHDAKAKLARIAAPTRSALVNYLASEGLTGENITAVMLDLGYSGTIQKLITYLLEKDTKGLYFIASKSGENEVQHNIADMKGVFFNDVKWGDGCTMLERSLFFESLMTAPHGQVIDVRHMADGSFEFLYGRETSTQHSFHDLKAVIDGGIAAAREGILNNVEYTPAEVSDLYAVFAKTPGAIPSSVAHLFNVEDDYSGNGIVDAKQLFGI